MNPFNLKQQRDLDIIGAKCVSDSGVYVEGTSYRRTMIFTAPNMTGLLSNRLVKTEIVVDRMPQGSTAFASVWNGNDWSGMNAIPEVQWWADAPGYMRAADPRSDKFTLDLSIRLVTAMERLLADAEVI